MSVQQDEITYILPDPLTTTYLPQCSRVAITSEEELQESKSKTEFTGPNGTTWYAAVFLVVNAALGAGLLDFPKTFGDAGGVTVAIVVQMVMLSFVIGALLILAHCSDAHESKTYQDVIASVCGKRAQQVCSLLVALYCFGTCVTFVIIIGDQFDRVFASLYGSDFCHQWYMNRYVTITGSCVLFILPMCFSKRIDYLKYASSFGVMAVLYIDFVIIYKYYEGKYVPGEIKTKPEAWTDIFFVIPVICFGYQCHVSCVPVYSCIKDRRVGVFLRTVIVAIVICAFTYTIAATFGYLTFGSQVQSDILYMYDAKDPIVIVAILALTIKVFSTYPILQFCGRAAIDDLYVQIVFNNEQERLANEKPRRLIISFVWFIISVVLALFIPDIGLVIEYLGSLAAVFIFIFPGFCLLELTLWRDTYFYSSFSKILIIVGGLFITTGFFIFGLVITQSLQLTLNHKHGVTDLQLCTA